MNSLNHTTDKINRINREQELLKNVKKYEAEHPKKAVRIDSRTFILVDADRDADEARKSFIDAQNEQIKKNEKLKFKDE